MDGVLCTPRACIATGNTGVFSFLDPIACMLVRNLCEDFDAKLVISSSWRILHPERFSFMAILNAACPNLGKHLYPDDVWWRTQTYPFDSYPDKENRRGYEIQQWLKENDLNTKMFIILDDDSDIAPYQDYFVKCDVYDGLTTQGYFKARALLGEA